MNDKAQIENTSDSQSEELSVARVEDFIIDTTVHIQPILLPLRKWKMNITTL